MIEFTVELSSTQLWVGALYLMAGLSVGILFAFISYIGSRFGGGSSNPLILVPICMLFWPILVAIFLVLFIWNEIT